jgi:hypothetical protein
MVNWLLLSRLIRVANSGHVPASELTSSRRRAWAGYWLESREVLNVQRARYSRRVKRR